MSRYLARRCQGMKPYVPGEQPQDRRYVKLNTNESPFPPCEGVQEAVLGEIQRLQRYPDPESSRLTKVLAESLHVREENVLAGNGSDELILYTFLAYAGGGNDTSAGEVAGFAAPDVTYGFYQTVSDFFHFPLRKIPVWEDFSLDVEAFCDTPENVIFANPNAPTGLFLPLEQVERIVRSRPERIVAVDEAYIDFGGESALSLLQKYENLLVIRTFSKSRSLAGARLGFVAGDPALIKDLRTIKNAMNPYNISRLNEAAGLAALKDGTYDEMNCRRIMKTREETKQALMRRGIEVLDSSANFLFVRPGFLSGADFYRRLKEKGVLIRYWDSDRIADWCRVSIGTDEEMQVFLKAVDELKGEIS